MDNVIAGQCIAIGCYHAETMALHCATFATMRGHLGRNRSAGPIGKRVALGSKTAAKQGNSLCGLVHIPHRFICKPV